ncbi:hypothetical protein L596_014490 [Steinernema carpocapsae]|uniref:Uncharacterized protein n=1 Tax=Steinernema carpocapsae TaxID=34508 RepID=A0A4U5ND55_STECR|nr:hypothetical protein L596_014490 [Steinernema carpocapsae]
MAQKDVLEETSQLWVLRHLRLVLGDVDDRTLTRFAFEEDCTPLRNFASHLTDSPALFLTVERRTDVIPNAPLVEKSAKAKPKKKKEVKTKADVKKPMKPPMKKKSKKAEEQEAKKEAEKTTEKTKLEPRKSGKKKKEAEEKKVELPNVVAEELKLMEAAIPTLKMDDQEVRMEWCLGTIPKASEFLYFVERDRPREVEQSEFDQAFLVGHCVSGVRLGSLIGNARILLDNRITFRRELQIFLFFVEVVNCGGIEKGENEFEDFLYGSIGRTFAAPKRVSMTGFDQVTTIDEILKPRVEEFMKNADEDNSHRLLLELSFFEVKQFADEDDVGSLCQRLDRVEGALQVYVEFFLDSNKEFFRKLYLFVVENCFKIIAENLKRKCKYLEQDFFDPIEDCLENMHISREILPRILRILELKEHEYAQVAKTKPNFKLLEVLEEDLDGIKESGGGYRELSKTLEEACIESMLESANFESLRAFCQRVDVHRLSFVALLNQLP